VLVLPTRPLTRFERQIERRTQRRLLIPQLEQYTRTHLSMLVKLMSTEYAVPKVHTKLARARKGFVCAMALRFAGNSRQED
jgi:hypothetical protein